jgi:DNA-binding transcriptional LysR family regulator
MHQKHLRAIDLNLLPVLDALLRHRNATRAGDEVGLSQPAMSRALGRLRSLLDDPLLVRGASGYLLSPRAEALRPSLAALLEEVRTMLSRDAFDPAAEYRTLRIAMTDANASLIFASLVKRVLLEAPGITLERVAIGPGLQDRVLTGEVDLVLALASTPLPRGAASEPLAQDELAVVVRGGHPCGGAWPLDYYERYPSVVVSMLGDAASDLDAELAAAGVTRSISAIVPSFASALEVVAATDSVTTISRSFAERHARAHGLQVLNAPLRDPMLPIVTVWARFRTADPLLAWLRSLLRDEYATLALDSSSAPAPAARRPREE